MLNQLSLFINSYPSRFAIGGFLLLIPFSCISPDPLTDLVPEEKDLYVTNRDQSANFANYKTYVISNSVQVVSKTSDSTQKSVSSGTLILNTINAELQKKGFDKTDTSHNPDVGISVSALRFTEDAPVAYYPYLSGGAYSGYASPAFYGFPGYGYAFPPYYAYYEIDVGSISIEMFDLKTARTSGGNKINVIWSAVLAGSLTDSTSGNNNDRIVKAITGAFDQSPYLKDGK